MQQEELYSVQVAIQRFDMETEVVHEASQQSVLKYEANAL
jgi:hypothetical protein